MTRSAVPPTSRLAGFYDLPLAERRTQLRAHAGHLLSPASLEWLETTGLTLAAADPLSENVVGVLGLPLALGLNFTIDGADRLIAMSTEEPSVVAAASNAARVVREHGGFVTSADPSVMTAQIQLIGVREPATLAQRLQQGRVAILAAANAAIPRMVARGGGAFEAEVSWLGGEHAMAVVLLHIDVGDAMGANLCDTVAEAAAPQCAQWLGGQIGLRILTNLALRRLARASCTIPLAALGSSRDPAGDATAQAIVLATEFARRDVARAATHNKGIMNGIVAAGLAAGQDTRALEAGAHAYAARAGNYGPLSTWQLSDGELHGAVELPLAVGTIGGSTHLPHARFALELMAATSARDLARVLACVGLASNLAALRALAAEGIQAGHMRLHRRRHTAG